jgi:hypothetical protein
MTDVRYACGDCGISVEGNLETTPLARLGVEEQVFVAAFVRVHGNIKKMCALFDVSYPTMKKRLETVAETLDAMLKEPVSRGEILERLDKGEISVAEALTLLDQ